MCECISITFRGKRESEHWLAVALVFLVNCAISRRASGWASYCANSYSLWVQLSARRVELLLALRTIWPCLHGYYNQGLGAISGRGRFPGVETKRR
jgi:hypothetical protein